MSQFIRKAGLGAALVVASLLAAPSAQACAPSSPLWRTQPAWCARMVETRIGSACYLAARLDAPAGRKLNVPKLRACRTEAGLPAAKSLPAKPRSHAEALRAVSHALRHGDAADQLEALADQLELLQ